MSRERFAYHGCTTAGDAVRGPVSRPRKALRDEVLRALHAPAWEQRSGFAVRSETRSGCRLPVWHATGGRSVFRCMGGTRSALRTACTDVSAGTWERRRATQLDSLSAARRKSSGSVAWPPPETRCHRRIKQGSHEFEHDKNAVNRHNPGGESLGLLAPPAFFPPQSSLCPGCRSLPPVDCSQWRDAGHPRPSDRSRNG